MHFDTGRYAAFLALAVPSILASPIARQSFSKLAGDSDLIIVGAASGNLSHGTVDATIQVEHVLKGAVAVGSRVSVLWREPESSLGLPPADTRTYPVSGHGLFFLVRGPDGSLSLLPAVSGAVGWNMAYIATPTSVPESVRVAALASLPSRPSVLDKLFAEIVIAEEVGPPPLLPFELVLNFRSVSRSPVLTAAFSRFSASQVPRLRFLGLRGGVVTGDPDLVLRAYQTSVTSSSKADWDALMMEIRTHYGNTSPEAIRNLGQVANDITCRSDLRIAAAAALARLHTRQSLAYLAELLDDPDLTLRAMAVGGLSSFANNVSIGSHEPAAGPWKYRTDDTIAHSLFDASVLRQNEGYYLGFWRSWWRQYQSELAQ